MKGTIKVQFDDQAKAALTRMMRNLREYDYSDKLEALKNVKIKDDIAEYKVWSIRDHEDLHGLVTFDLLDEHNYHVKLDLKNPSNIFTEIEIPADFAHQYGFIKTDTKWQCGDIVSICLLGENHHGYEIISIDTEDKPLQYTVDRDGDAWYVAESHYIDDYYFITGYTNDQQESPKELHYSEDSDTKGTIIKTVTVANDNLDIEIDKEFVIVEFSTLVNADGSKVDDIYTFVLKFNEENAAQLIELIRKEKEKRAKSCR